MGYIGQLRQRLEVLPQLDVGVGAPPEPAGAGGPRADELPGPLPAGAQSVTVTVPTKRSSEDDSD